jgi:predicted PurR-regulated permease PerM
MQAHRGAEQDQIVEKFILIAAGMVVVIAGLRAAEAIAVPFLLSVFIAIICAPALAWLQRRKVPVGLAIILIMVAMLVVGLMVAGLVGTSLNNFSDQMPLYQSRLQQMSGSVVAQLAEWGVTVPEGVWKDHFDPGVAMKLVAQMLNTLGNVMGNAFMILLTVVFILAEMSGFRSKVHAIADDREATEETVNSFIENINQYMAMKSWISLLTGLVVTSGLWLIGVDYPLLWGLLAFMLNFVPSLGSSIAAVPAVLLDLVELGVGSAMLTGGLYLAVNVIVGNVIEPKYMGKGLNLSALVVFLSLVFWGWVLGPVGMLLSVPLTMAVKIGLESREEYRWVGVLLGSAEPEAPDLAHEQPGTEQESNSER